PLLVAHMRDARRVPNRVGVSLRKDHRVSARKMDLAVREVGAGVVRRLVLTRRRKHEPPPVGTLLQGRLVVVAVSDFSVSTIEGLVEESLWPLWQEERDRMLRLDRWYQNRLLSGTDLPKLKKGTDEYRALQRIAVTPWAKLIVHSVTDTLYLQGIMDGDGQLDEELWRVWEVNGMDGKQSAVWEGAGALGRSYMTAVPGVDELT